MLRIRHIATSKPDNLKAENELAETIFSYEELCVFGVTIWVANYKKRRIPVGVIFLETEKCR